MGVQLSVVRRYFDAWNSHRGKSVLDMFARRGIYRDPLVPEGVTGTGISEYAEGLWSAFPDFFLQISEPLMSESGRMAVEWVLRGTNSGPLLGRGPTGRSISLRGVSVIDFDGERIIAVQGYYDSRELHLQIDSAN
jgi:steroid delta-isomerase-like uncharacterized protein